MYGPDLRWLRPVPAYAAYIFALAAFLLLVLIYGLQKNRRLQDIVEFLGG